MKRFIRVVLLLCVAVVLLGALSLKTVGAKATSSSWRVSPKLFSSNACLLRKWGVVPSPNPNGPGVLNGVAAVSARDIWAVGSSGSQATGGQTLIEHWDGALWQIVTGPNPSSIYNSLYAVSAVSTTDVWAVGYEVNASRAPQTLIEHWNGTSWSVVTSPNPGSTSDELFSVVAVSATNVWAVGYTTNSKFVQTALIEHWNGKRWSVVNNPSPGANDSLSSVVAVSATDVWAVGEGNNFAQTLIEHWNGKRWSVVASPSPGSSSSLSGVTAVSASNIWAAGYYSDGGSSQTLVEHWNGTSWHVVKSPNAGTRSSLWAVVAVSATDVWAVGSYGTDTMFNVALAEHWNGKQWKVVTSPSPGSFSTQLLGLAALSSTNIWAVGPADSNTLIEHYTCSVQVGA